MKLRYLQLLILAALLAFPVHAQVKLDSAEVARILQGVPEKIVPPTEELSPDNDEEGESAILPFQNDSHLSWQENVKAHLDGILQTDIATTMQIGVMVWDLSDDKQIYGFNERTQLRPASTMKCVTAIAALHRLGNNYNYRTGIYYTGTIDDSTKVLNGDIYCVGGMDPMISNNDITAIAQAIKDLDISRINGSIYADLSFKDKDELGSGWCWDDKNPRLRPLLLGKSDSFIGTLLRRLREQGIEPNGIIGERTLPADATLITMRTHSIGEVMQDMMKKSDNLYAESMFYQLAAANGGKWTSSKQASKEVNALIRQVGLSPSSYRIADGSGLSLYNYVSAELEVQLLRYAYTQPNIYNTLLPTLPIAGVDGTLKKRMRNTPAEGNVRAKTGTLFGVSSLAGYLTASNGHQICFAIIVNGGMSQGPMRNLQNKICVALSQ
ncbi:MAG: D-alanyl-D-alanine carboxypeptidase/D-alanyl-D-alanine endopeptidase [Prevotella intermedia]